MSAIAVLNCGCSIEEDMFSNMTLSVCHCSNHRYLFSDSKTIKEMAREIRELHGLIPICSNSSSRASKTLKDS